MNAAECIDLDIPWTKLVRIRDSFPIDIILDENNELCIEEPSICALETWFKKYQRYIMLITMQKCPQPICICSSNIRAYVALAKIALGNADMLRRAYERISMLLAQRHNPARITHKLRRL